MVRELVTLNGEVSADLLTYIADNNEDRMQLLKQHACEEMALKEKAGGGFAASSGRQVSTAEAQSCG